MARGSGDEDNGCADDRGTPLDVVSIRFTRAIVLFFYYWHVHNVVIFGYWLVTMGPNSFRPSSRSFAQRMAYDIFEYPRTIRHQMASQKGLSKHSRQPRKMQSERGYR